MKSQVSQSGAVGGRGRREWRDPAREDAGGILQPNQKMMIINTAVRSICARRLTAMKQVSRCALQRAGGKIGSSPDPELLCTS